MRAPVPQDFQWNGEAMVPYQPRLADRQYVVGERYTLAVEAPRSDASHRHFFASLHDAWLNLRDEHAARFLTSEHLRKWALIQAGFRDERTFVAASKAEAVRLAGFLKPMDDYAVITVSECVVIVYSAKSQSVRAMGSDDFQRSKTAVLDIVSAMIGTDAGTLSNNAGQSA